jgi:branched-chain amino acid aminotransferase
MTRLAVIDGEVFAPEEARVSVYDRGFLYGDSVFETVRTYAGVLFCLDEHLRRLEESAAKIGLALPIPRDALGEETRRAVAQAANPESFARIMLTRGSGPLGLDTALAEAALRVTLIEPLVMPPVEHYRDGISTRCIETVRASDAADNAKLGNYLASALALRKARDAGAVEALVVNRLGLVVEGTTANVFAVISGKLVTPALEAGILEGITRHYVIDLARERGIEVELRALRPDEIVLVDELFLTSTIREILPVVSVDGQSIGNGRPGPVTQSLHRAFRTLVGMDGKLPFEVPGVALAST